MSKDIKEIAKELLSSGKVSVVVGYAEGSIPGKAQTHMARTPEQAEKFVFNKYCVYNLAVYLTRAYKLPRPVGIFLKPCDMKAVIGLMQEHQITREDVVIIGLPCEGLLDGESNKPAARCMSCTVHNPQTYDILALDPVEEKPVQNGGNPFARIEAIENMPIEERWNFWMKEFDKCVRCYACRQACPMCYCEQCVVDKTQPRWIESSAHPIGNLGWHLIRAFHLAGRCIGCGECERVCHQNIPLGMLNMKMAKEVFDLYGYRTGIDAGAKPPLVDYRMEDNQDFIR